MRLVRTIVPLLLAIAWSSLVLQAQNSSTAPGSIQTTTTAPSGDKAVTPTTDTTQPVADKTVTPSANNDASATTDTNGEGQGPAAGGVKNDDTGTAKGSEVITWLCTTSRRNEILLVLVTGLCYWFAMVVIRWHRIAKPSREFIRAQIANDRVELNLLPAQTGQDPADWRSQINDLLEQASRAISPEAVGRDYLYRLANFVFWSRGEEMSAWTYLHSAEVKMARYFLPETVTTRLESVEQQLRTFNDPQCLVLANTINGALTAKDPGTDITRRRALLVAGLAAVYQHSDNSASDDISWQNKTSWLVGCGVFVLVVLTIAVPHHAILLVVGGLGGLVSRMTRSLDRKSVPTDYGASWTSLFLSPVTGALGAWAGILIVNLAAELRVLGDMFQADFNNPCNTRTLGIALIFGFSERLLDGVLDKLEEKTGAVPPRTASITSTTTQTASSTLAITSQSQDLPKGTVGQDYTVQLAATGATGDVKWSVSDGLPGGLQLTDEKAGIISGKPAAAGTFNFTVTATDQSANPKTQPLTIVIEDAGNVDAGVGAGPGGQAGEPGSSSTADSKAANN